MSTLIDINAAYGSWPFRRVGHANLAALRDHLRDEGIATALAAHLGAVFHADPDPFNRELVAESRGLEGILPVPILNPHLPGWRERLARYRGEADVRAVRVLPSYHGYRLYTRPVFDLLEHTAEAGVRVLVQLRLEDERQQYFGLRIKPVPVKQVVRLARRFSDLPFVCLNAYLPEARTLAEETTTVAVDTAFAEWMYAVEELRAVLPVERIFFGSHTPLLVTRASVMKLTHAGRPEDEVHAIGRENARVFFDLDKLEDGGWRMENGSR